LADGRTLIAGGFVDGVPSTSVVVYDPVDNSFVPAGEMLAARVGHTATVLEDGRVLIAGGMVADQTVADLELFNPADGSSAAVGQMQSARSGHGAARLADGTVLLVGGTNGSAALASAELFDPASDQSAPTVGSMSVGRAGASATLLTDNRVLVAGGNNGAQDLASAEIYSPFAQSFEPTTTNLSVARSGHSAVLLPWNGSVLIAGGSSDGVATDATDLFLPAIFPDPYSYGMGEFVATDALAAPRTGSIGGPAGVDGFAFVAGGSTTDSNGQPVALSNGEGYRFATVKTDKDDYAPGEHARITGSGWQPNSEVTLLFQEDPAVHADYVLSVPTDGQGNIDFSGWSPESHDLGVTFYLTASDGASLAQTIFTDANVSISPGVFPSSGYELIAPGNFKDFSATATRGGPPTDPNPVISGFTTTGVVGNPACGIAADTALPVSWLTVVSAPVTVSSSTGQSVTFKVTVPAGQAPGNYRARFKLSMTTGGMNGNLDFCVTVASNADPSAPTALSQFKSNGTTSIATGGVTNETTVVLKGNVSDPNAADTVKLEVEVKAVGTAFANSATASSALLTNGSTASVSVPGLSDGVGYHWQARTVDNNGAASNWAPFAGNPETSADFTVDTTPPAPPSTPDLDNADDTGASNTDNVTKNSTGLTFTGTAEAGSSVQLYDGAIAVGSPVTATGGNWSINLNLSEGLHSISAKATDAATNESTASGPLLVRVDLTAPSVSADPDRAPNANNWYNADVIVTFSGTDVGGSGIDSCDPPVTLGEGAGQSATGSCTDVAGNSASATASGINIDKTAPSISVALDRAPGGSGWFNISTGRPTANFTCSDALSGLDGACPASVGPFADGANQTVSGSVTDKAGNSSSASLNDIDVDLGAPNVAITTPADGAIYTVGQLVQADYACSDALSGLVPGSCTGTVADGANISTTPGAHSFTVTASDNAGNTATLTHNYDAHYAFSGFFHPIDNLPTVNRVKAGSAIPVKFSLGGNQGLSIFAAGYPNVTLYQCDASPEDEIELTVNAGNSSLSYDPGNNQYIYVWKTQKPWGGSCGLLTVKLNDDTIHTAKFDFTR
jgi:hypothetical protein